MVSMASLVLAVSCFSIVTFLLGTCAALWLKPRPQFHGPPTPPASHRSVAGMQLEIEELKATVQALKAEVSTINGTAIDALSRKIGDTASELATWREGVKVMADAFMNARDSFNKHADGYDAGIELLRRAHCDLQVKVAKLQARTESDYAELIRRYAQPPYLSQGYTCTSAAAFSHQSQSPPVDRNETETF